MNHSAEKRELILKNASMLFSQKGYFGVGINEIVSACDIPKGSFYHYFPGGKISLRLRSFMMLIIKWKWVFERIFSLCQRVQLRCFAGWRSVWPGILMKDGKD